MKYYELLSYGGEPQAYVGTGTYTRLQSAPL
jgi:hypothetical protein